MKKITQSLINYQLSILENIKLLNKVIQNSPYPIVKQGAIDSLKFNREELKFYGKLQRKFENENTEVSN